jgi:serine/threonine protein kinase/Tfp pilus assembly protein PilF
MLPGGAQTMVGKVVASFEIVDKIGGGGMGVVYKARDLKLGRFVAMKFLTAEPRADQVTKARFIQEARAVSILDHPNICTIYQVGETDDGQMYIVMGFYEGETVDLKIARGPLRVEEAVAIAAQTAAGLAKAHEVGITHRDIKPANILVTPGGLVKVLDFGIAKLGEGAHLTREGTAVGTLPYMSPEQLAGEAVDGRTDIWSLGVVLYQMLAGRLPFTGDNPGAVVHAILHRDPPPLAAVRGDVPPGVEDIVGKMLAKERSRRFHSAAQLAEILQTLSGRGPSTSPSWETATLPAATWAPVETSIAVLPFVNLSGDQEQEYFSDGITEDIIAQISKLPGVRVIARTSVMRYKNSTKDLGEIARDLRVSHLVEGSVRRAGNRVRITSGLVEAATQRQLWVETYDRELTDIFSIQTDVSRRVAAALMTTLSPTLRLRLATEPRDIEAYQIFLRARYFLNKVSPEGIVKAIQLFQQALDVDPADARCYAGISTCYATAGHFDFMPPQEAFPKAKAAAEKAIEINANLPEAHTSMALVQMFWDWDWQAAEHSFSRAIALNPNWAEARTYFSWYHCAVRHWERAVFEARRALELDPVSSFVNTNLGWVFTMAGRFEEAIDQLERTLELDPNYLPAWTLLGQAHLGKGNYARAFEYLNKWAWRRSFVALGYSWAGENQQARRLLEEILESGASAHWRPSEIALVYLWLGERDEARRWLERALAERDYMLSFHMCAEWVRNRNDPLVVEYLQKMGLEP